MPPGAGLVIVVDGMQQGDIKRLVQRIIKAEIKPSLLIIYRADRL